MGNIFVAAQNATMVMENVYINFSSSSSILPQQQPLSIGKRKRTTKSDTSLSSSSSKVNKKKKIVSSIDDNTTNSNLLLNEDRNEVKYDLDRSEERTNTINSKGVDCRRVKFTGATDLLLVPIKHLAEFLTGKCNQFALPHHPLNGILNLFVELKAFPRKFVVKDQDQIAGEAEALGRLTCRNVQGIWTDLGSIVVSIRVPREKQVTQSPSCSTSIFAIPSSVQTSSEFNATSKKFYPEDKISGHAIIADHYFSQAVSDSREFINCLLFVLKPLNVDDLQKLSNVAKIEPDTFVADSASESQCQDFRKSTESNNSSKNDFKSELHSDSNNIFRNNESKNKRNSMCTMEENDDFDDKIISSEISDINSANDCNSYDTNNYYADEDQIVIDLRDIDREEERQRDIKILMNWQYAALRPYLSSSLSGLYYNNIMTDESSCKDGNGDEEEQMLSMNKVENFLMNKSVAGVQF
jgi:hypothetical protein